MSNREFVLFLRKRDQCAQIVDVGEIGRYFRARDARPLRFFESPFLKQPPGFREKPRCFALGEKPTQKIHQHSGVTVSGSLVAGAISTLLLPSRLP
jgi:hypothetical protein